MSELRRRRMPEDSGHFSSASPDRNERLGLLSPPHLRPALGESPGKAANRRRRAQMGNETVLSINRARTPVPLETEQQTQSPASPDNHTAAKTPKNCSKKKLFQGMTCLSDDEVISVFLFLPVETLVNTCAVVNSRFYQMISDAPSAQYFGPVASSTTFPPSQQLVGRGANSSSGLWDFLYHRDVPPAFHYLTMLLLKHTIATEQGGGPGYHPNGKRKSRRSPLAAPSPARSEDVGMESWYSATSTNTTADLDQVARRQQETAATARTVEEEEKDDGGELQSRPLANSDPTAAQQQTRTAGGGEEQEDDDDDDDDGMGFRLDSSCLVEDEPMESEVTEVDPNAAPAEPLHLAFAAPRVIRFDAEEFLTALLLNLDAFYKEGRFLCQAAARTATLTQNDGVSLEASLPEGTFEHFINTSSKKVSWHFLYLRLQRANFYEEADISEYVSHIDTHTQIPAALKGLLFEGAQLDQHIGKKCRNAMMSFFASRSMLQVLAKNVEDEFLNQAQADAEAVLDAKRRAIEAERAHAAQFGKEDPYPGGREDINRLNQLGLPPRQRSVEEEKCLKQKAHSERRWKSLKQRNLTQRHKEKSFLPSNNWRLRRYNFIRQKVLRAGLLSELYLVSWLGQCFVILAVGSQVMAAFFINPVLADATFYLRHLRPGFGLYPAWCLHPFFWSVTSQIRGSGAHGFGQAMVMYVTRAVFGQPASGATGDTSWASRASAANATHPVMEDAVDEEPTSLSVPVFLFWSIVLICFRIFGTVHFYPRIRIEATKLADWKLKFIEIASDVVASLGSVSAIIGFLWLLVPLFDLNSALPLLIPLGCHAFIYLRFMSSLSFLQRGMILLPSFLFSIWILAPYLSLVRSFAFEHCRDWTFWVLHPMQFINLSTGAQNWTTGRSYRHYYMYYDYDTSSGTSSSSAQAEGEVASAGTGLHYFEEGRPPTECWTNMEQTLIMSMYLMVGFLAALKLIMFRFSQFHRCLRELLPEISPTEVTLWFRQQEKVHETKPYLDVISELVNAKAVDEAALDQEKLYLGAMLSAMEELMLGAMFIAVVVDGGSVPHAVFIRVLISIIVRVAQQLAIHYQLQIPFLLQRS